jgi:hypothetical protein
MSNARNPEIDVVYRLESYPKVGMHPHDSCWIIPGTIRTNS